MKALFELFRRFDARRIFGFIRRLGGMSRPKVKCYDLRSTHALRVEGDLNISDLQMSYITFLSTPSGWRATRAFHTVTRRSDYFYPRPPGGGRQLDGASKGYGAAISIHALRVEGDGTMMRFFPSTNSHFYPRPPGGGRLVVATGQATVVAFLSTPSGWRATLSTALHGAQRRFLSTPSGWRATDEIPQSKMRKPDFYPRPPGGGRL